MALASKLSRIIGLLGLALALTGCSAVKLGYNTAPELVYRWLDGYLDFNDNQASQVRDELARLHQWHRAQELPRYVTLLGQMERLALADVHTDQVCSLMTDVRSRITAITDQAEPVVGVIAASLKPDQLLHLRRRYEREDADYRKDWLDASPEASQDRRYRLWLDRSETVYGSLSEPQQVLLRQQLQQSGFNASVALAERQRRQRDILDTLRQITSPATTPASRRVLLRDVLERIQTSPDPTARRLRDQQLQDSCRTVAALHNSTTPAQREAATRRLRAYQRDLRELSAR